MITERNAGCPNIINHIKHIFGKGLIKYTRAGNAASRVIREYELGLDYIQLLYTKPTQPLPILCLVSKENATGKTTFFKLLQIVLSNNAIRLDNHEFSSPFNDAWAEKLLIMFDAPNIDKQVVIERVKSLSSINTIYVNAKGKPRKEVDFFGKFLFASNNEENFIAAQEETMPLWVRKVPPFAAGVSDAAIMDIMAKEIPNFLVFLSNRITVTKCESPYWFKPSLISTEPMQQKETNPIDIVAQMVKDNNQGIAASNTIVSLDINDPRGGLITFGLDEVRTASLVSEESFAICIVINKDEYDKYK